MATVTFRYYNSRQKPVNVQIDPWAGCYRVGAGEQIEFVAESTTDAPEFWLDDYGDEVILTIWHSSDYFIVRDDQRVHWTEFPNSGLE